MNSINHVNITYLLEPMNQIYNSSMSQLPNNEKITTNVTKIPVYTHFKYVDYLTELNMSLMLNPTELTKWSIQKNTSNANRDNNIKENIKTLTTIIFKKGNILNINNQANTILSYKFYDSDKIISNNIPVQYFLNSINKLDQYNKYETLNKEIQELNIKLNDHSLDKSSVMEDTIKLCEKKAEVLSVITELNFKDKLNGNSDINALSQFGDLPEPKDIRTDGSIQNIYMLNTYYYTYYSYAKIFRNIWESYKKHNLSPDKRLLTNLIRSLFNNRYNNISTTTFAETMINDAINKLQSSKTESYKINLIYYLLDYIVILKIITQYLDNDTKLPNIEMANLLTDNDINFTDKSYIFNNLIKLCNPSQHVEKYQQTVNIPMIFDTYLLKNTSDFSNYISDRERNRLPAEIARLQAAIARLAPAQAAERARLQDELARIQDVLARIHAGPVHGPLRNYFVMNKPLDNIQPHTYSDKFESTIKLYNKLMPSIVNSVENMISNLYEKIYKLDIIYIHLLSTLDQILTNTPDIREDPHNLINTSMNRIELILSDAAMWLICIYNEQIKAQPNIGTVIDNPTQLTKLFKSVSIDGNIQSIVNINDIQNRIHYVISLSKYIHYFETNIDQLIETNKDIYKKNSVCICDPEVN